MLLGDEVLEMNPDTKQPALFLTLKAITFEIGVRLILSWGDVRRETCTVSCFGWSFLPNISATNRRYQKPVISLPNFRNRCALTDLQSLCVVSYLDITSRLSGYQFSSRGLICERSTDRPSVFYALEWDCGQDGVRSSDPLSLQLSASQRWEVYGRKIQSLKEQCNLDN